MSKKEEELTCTIDFSKFKESKHKKIKLRPDAPEGHWEIEVYELTPIKKKGVKHGTTHTN
jgi:hypothetical protein